ncbi:hypothetical protein ILUMI_22765 [Ignelater luminosus]|uniref:Amidase domain-containing protein n=1 Tax=Ignelater luminosus TaxID=2038154 RepID=A0A8K0CFZ9_IGNLU|nr:hypothetical protein ILUMI_22765 [Ignelater luminosus]
MQEKKALPPMDEPVPFLSATTLADKIRKQQAYIKRIKQVNQILNAVFEDRFIDAIEDARKVDKYIANTILTEKELERCKPLLGIPETVKQSCSVEGSLKRVDVKAASDCAALHRLREAGAIPILISNTPEMCVSWECNNLITGTTCNAYDINCSSGGSSGGESRLPAMFNGVFGHKSTPGVIPIGHWPRTPDESFRVYFTPGPLTRFAEDLKLMMTALSGNISTEIKLHEKIIYMKVDLVPAVQQEIRAAVVDAQKDNLYIELLKCIFGASKYHRDILLFYLLMKANALIPRKKRGKYENAYNHLRQLFLSKLNTSGVFLYPTFPTSAFRHGELLPKVTGMMYSILFNVLGFPATQIPTGFDKNGLPIGLQVVAAPNQDRLCIAVAMELEKRFGGWIPPA